MEGNKDKIKNTVNELSLNSDEDLINIRRYTRNLACKVGFDQNDCTMIATAISEVCRNAIDYAGEGKVFIEICNANQDLIITVKDHGPGIENVSMAMQEGFSSGNGLGIGLPGAKRIMDTFEIKTEVNKGTTVIMSKSMKKRLLK